MFIIYQIKNILNDFVYVGSTTNFKKRKQRHLRELKNNKHHSIFLQEAFNKYGEDNFKFDILFEFDNKEDMLSKELSLLQDLTNKYNISKHSTCGDLISYHPNIDQIKQKHSENYQRIKKENNGVHPFELIDVKGKNNPNWKHGKFCDDKYCIDCNKKTTIGTQRCRSCNAKLKTGAKNPFFGKKHTPETIKKILANRDLQKLPSNTLKVVIDNIIYDSASKASKVIGCTTSSILNRCKNPKFPNYEIYKGNK